ncbi:MAG: hypothetical protein JWQ19_2976 [Subtercola sp.]|nr:hypothetical protein [Subtercola sp.]
MMSDTPYELVEGRIYALTGSIPLDGTASWAPVEEGRSQSLTCWLLKEGDQHMVVDTGVRALWPHISAQLATIVPPGSSLKIFMTRPEPDAVGNLAVIREVYSMEDTDVLAGGNDTPFDFFETAASSRGSRKSSGATPGVLRTTGFDLSPDRPIRVIVPKLRFLPSYWPYDITTKTLFTSDVFTHVSQKTGDPLPIVESPEPPDADEVARHLFSKFWWLPGATTREFVDDLRGIFDRLQPEIVAPAYGGVLKGRAVIEAHLETMLEVLEGSERGDYGQPAVLDAAYVR